MFIKVGRFGPYVQLGDNDDPDKKNRSLLKGMTPEELTVETALKLFTLPRNLGIYPENKSPLKPTMGAMDRTSSAVPIPARYLPVSARWK